MIILILKDNNFTIYGGDCFWFWSATKTRAPPHHSPAADPRVEHDLQRGAGTGPVPHHQHQTVTSDSCSSSGV